MLNSLKYKPNWLDSLPSHDSQSVVKRLSKEKAELSEYLEQLKEQYKVLNELVKEQYRPREQYWREYGR